MPNRSPAIRKFWPARTRSAKSGIRWRKAPFFQRSSSASRLSETHQAEGVIWSVSMASRLRPGRFGSQKMRASPVTGRYRDPPALSAAAGGKGIPGFRRTGRMRMVSSIERAPRSLEFRPVLARFPSLLLAGLVASAPVAGSETRPPSEGNASQRAPADAGANADSPSIFLLTMGPDQSVIFRKWGHAALCIEDQCLNYGVTDFSRPVGLAREVLAGEARFWVAASSYEDMVAVYSRDDRSVFRQDLDLLPEGRSRLLSRLAHDLTPGQSEYVYDHFGDNCTTRIRDYLDEASGGRLRDPVALPLPFEQAGRRPTFRAHIRRGLHDDPLLLWLSDVGVGSVVDEPISSFDAMFLPGALRYGVEASLGAAPVRLHTGSDGDLLPPDPRAGPYLPWLLGIALIFAMLIAGPVPGLARIGRGVAATVMGSLGVVAAAVLVASPLPEFRTSLAILALPATDFLLATRHAHWYGPSRLLAGAGLLLAILAGLVRQPLGWTVLAALLPVAALVWRSRNPLPIGAR